MGGLLGLWSVAGSNNERLTLLSIEAATMLVLVANSFAIKCWVYRTTTNPLYRRLGWLGFLSLALCFCGDVVNFNLPQTLYRHGGVVRHDYLADSVLFFAPGYLLLLAAVVLVTVRNNIGPTVWGGIFVVAAVAGIASFASMHLPGTGFYVSMLTGGYSVLITAVGLSGVVLVICFGGVRASPGIWLVGLGLVLAAVADGIIGQFWLYGNDGAGYFPWAREVNWIIYVGSQCLVIHLPRVMLRQSQVTAAGHGSF